MKATFFLLLTLFFGFSVFAAEDQAEKNGDKAVSLQNEVKVTEAKGNPQPDPATEQKTEKLDGKAAPGKTQQAAIHELKENTTEKSISTEAELKGTATMERISTPEDIKYKKGKRIQNLILTANYRSPALLAEIARKDSNVIYILLPTEYSENQKIMVYPPKIENIFELPEEKLSSFLAFVNPKRVIILGGTEVVPPKYRLAVDPKMDCVEIEDLNWNINAIILGNLLMDRKMPQKFRAAFESAPVSYQGKK